MQTPNINCTEILKDLEAHKITVPQAATLIQSQVLKLATNIIKEMTAEHMEAIENL